MNTTLTFKDLYTELGRLADCPKEGIQQLLENCRGDLEGFCPEASSSLALLQKATAAWNQDEWEEAYLRAFDITPLAIPYASVHLFGEENYRRGEFMARLLEAYERTGFDCGTELPDHFAVLLRFAGKLEGEERMELLSLCLREPLIVMRAALQKNGHPYRYLLQAFLDVVDRELKTEVLNNTPSPLEGEGRVRGEAKPGVATLSPLVRGEKEMLSSNGCGSQEVHHA